MKMRPGSVSRTASSQVTGSIEDGISFNICLALNIYTGLILGLSYKVTENLGGIFKKRIYYRIVQMASSLVYISRKPIKQFVNQSVTGIGQSFHRAFGIRSRCVALDAEALLSN